MVQKTKKSPAKGKSKRARKSVRKSRKRGFLSRVFKYCAAALFVIFLFLVLMVTLFRFVDPPQGIYIQAEKMRLGDVKQRWTSIEDFSRHMPLSVVAAEDANYCLHNGFDIQAIKDAWEDGANRGASTISQQVAKNVFLWQGRSWVRKGMEVGFTILIEVIWPKERILEVYLNVAELDEGVFGAAAAAQHYFGVSPANITATQAARLAAILPNPKKRSASRPSAFVRKKTGRVIQGARTIAADGRASCF